MVVSEDTNNKGNAVGCSGSISSSNFTGSDSGKSFMNHSDQKDIERKHISEDDMNNNANAPLHQNKNATLTNYQIHSIIAGTGSGAITHALLHPLDSLKVRLQAEGRGKAINFREVGISATFLKAREVIKRERWRALYQGVGPSMLGGSTAWGLYFFIYNSSKENYQRKFESIRQKELGEESIRREDIPVQYLILSGLKAGMATCFLTHPIWLIKTRMQLQKKYVKMGEEEISKIPKQYREPYRNIFDAVRKIIHQEGVRGLFVGIGPSICLISHGIINFVMFDKMKSLYFRYHHSDEQFLNSRESFAIGGASKFIAAAMTYPFQVIKTRMQDQRNYYDSVRYQGMLDAIKKIYKIEGYQAFFRGVSAYALRVTPQTAVTFMLNEQIMRLLKAASNSENSQKI